MSEIDLMLALHAETTRAVLVSDTGEEARALWLPLSLVDIRRTGKSTAGTRTDGQAVNLPIVEASLPEWLAIKRGLA